MEDITGWQLFIWVATALVCLCFIVAGYIANLEKEDARRGKYRYPIVTKNKKKEDQK